MTELSNIIVYSDKFKVRFMFLVCLILLLLLVIFGFFVYPVPYTDAHVYIPPAVSYASSGKLDNPLFYLPSDFCKCDFGTSFVWLPPLFPMLIGILMPEATTLTAMRVITLFTSVSFILSNITLFIIIKKYFEALKSWIEVFVIVCAELLFVTILLAAQQSGRSEPLSIMIIILLVTGSVILSANRFTLLSGVLIGLLASIHFVPSIFAISLVAIFFSLNNYNFKSIFYRLAVIGIVSIITFLFILMISPNTIESIIRGILVHSEADGPIGASGRNANLSDFLLSNTKHKLLGLVLLMNTFLLLYFKRDSLQKIKGKFTLFIFVSVFGVTFWYFVLRENREHYLYLIVPIIFIVIILLHIQILRRHVAPYVKAILIFIIIPLSLLPATGFARAIGMFPFYLTELTLEKAHDKLQESAARLGDDYILVTELGGLLVDDHTRYRSVYTSESGTVETRSVLENFENTASALIVDQKYSGFSTPPDKLGRFRLLEDNFSYNNYEILGIPLSNSTPSWGFAIYVADD